MSKRTLLGCLGVGLLALAGAGTMVVLNWDTVIADASAALDTQSRKTQAALFRWGELMSLGAELKTRYGVEPQVTYTTSSDQRTLGIVFDGYPLPEQVSGEAHAREIAAFAVGKTKKFDQIDAVQVQFVSRSSQDSHTFALDDLLPRP